MAGRPQITVRTGPGYKLAEFLNDNWSRLVGKTNEEVAADLGYQRGHVISMWRTGRTRIPLEQLPHIASYMKLDIGMLLPMWLEQYWNSDTHDKEKAEHNKALLKRFSEIILRDTEIPIMKVIRGVTKGAGLSKRVLDAIAAVISNEAAATAALNAAATTKETTPA